MSATIEIIEQAATVTVAESTGSEVVTVNEVPQTVTIDVFHGEKGDPGNDGISPNADDILRSKWSLFTSVIDGCVLSIDPDDSTKVKNTAGHCLYVDCHDPNAPIVEVLTIPEAATTPTVGAEGLATLFLVWAGFQRTASGVGAITFSTEFTPAERRRIAVAGRLWATDLGASTIFATANYSVPSWGAEKTLEDLVFALGGALNIDGHYFTAHADQLTLDLSAGHAFRLFVNSGTDRDSPNCPGLSSAIAPVTAYRYWATAGSTYGNALHSTVDPDYYDVGGTRTPVPNSKWTIQQVYYFPSASATPTVAVAYGQAYYNTLNEAKTAAFSESHVFSDVATRMLKGGLLRARLYVRQGSTTLNSAYVEAMNAFVSGGASGGVLPVIDHAVLTNLDYANAGHTGFVPDTRTINGIALTGNIVLNSMPATSVNVAGPYTALTTDYVLNVFRTSAGACSIQLPAVVNDRVLIINDAGYLSAVNNITLIPDGTDRIDNVAANYLIRVNGASLTIIGTTNPNTGIKNWQVM